jgi:serine phosphatase RsbU (regulator of sigma subunit)/CHASE2 domain-containing sensor protein
MPRILLSMPVRIGLTLLLGAIFALLCFLYGWFTSVDLEVYDLGLNRRAQIDSSSEVVVISIDRNSREECFTPPYFPVSKHVIQHAQLIGRLDAAGAKAIAFDILFDQTDPRLDLDPFIAAIQEADNVLLAGMIESYILGSAGDDKSIREERLLLPTVSIPESLYHMGLVNVPLDPDQVTRRSYIGKEFQGKWYPSLPAAAASVLLGEKEENLGSIQPFYIDYSSPRGGVLTIPYVNILQKEGWQDSVKGKIALIGVVENGLGDTHFSPVPDLPGAAQRDKLPGVLFLAYATNTLLKGEMITNMPRHLSLLISLFLILGSSFLAFQRRLLLNLGLILLSVIILLICGTFLVASNITIAPTGKLTFIWLVTGAIGMLVNFSYTKLKSSEQETQLEEISSDLKMAQQIQQKLQPERIPAIKGVDISGFQIPCKQIGGDYYDVLQLSDRKVAMLVADVSGKGISGALVMSNFQSVVHSLAPKIFSVGKLLGELNTAVCKIVTPGRFVTFFYGILDLDSREFTYGNAGHNYPILCRANGQVDELKEGGLFLGPFPQGSWEEYRIQLGAGDILFLYTDGVTEAEIKKTEEQYGEDRLKRFLSENRTNTAEQIHQGLVKDLEDFTGSKLFDDDVTILTIKLI